MDESITITGVDAVLRAALEAEASRLGISLDEVIVRALSASVGLAGSSRLFRGLDAFTESLSLQGFQQQEDLEAAQRYLDEMGGMFEGM